MTFTSWPFDGVATTETQYSELFRRLQSDGVWGAPGDTTLSGFGDSSGMQVKMNVGYGMIRGFMAENDAIQIVAVTPPSAANRVDLLVLRLDPAANSITPIVLVGTSGSATPPAPTQTDTGIWEMPIATIAVGAGVSSITAGAVTDVRTFMGHQFGTWTTAQRPVAPRVGKTGWNTDLTALESWNGTAWIGIGGAAINVSVGIKANGGSTQTAYLSDVLKAKDDGTHGATGGGHTQLLSPNNVYGIDVVETDNTGSNSRVRFGKPNQLYPSTNDPDLEIGLASGLPAILWPVSNGSTHNGWFAMESADFAQGIYFQGTTVTLLQVYGHTTSTAANMVVGSGGLLSRSTSSKRYKKLIEKAAAMPTVLDIVPKTWVDKNDESETPVRHFGAIAEDLDGLGLTSLVQYDDEGRPDAISYERVAIALIPFVKDLVGRVEALEQGK